MSSPVDIVQPVSLHQVKKKHQKNKTKTTVHQIYIPLTVQHGFCLLRFLSFTIRFSMYSYRERMFNGGELICLIAHCTGDDDDDGGDYPERGRNIHLNGSQTKSRNT